MSILKSPGYFLTGSKIKDMQVRRIKNDNFHQATTHKVSQKMWSFYYELFWEKQRYSKQQF